MKLSGWHSQRPLLAASRALVTIIENRLGFVCTRPAARGNAKRVTQLVQVVATLRRGAANLFIGYGLADADVHVFNTLSA